MKNGFFKTLLMIFVLFVFFPLSSYAQKDAQRNTQRNTEPGQNKLKIFFIHVGQGDSEFIRLPSGKTLLIDGGPNANSVSSFLQSQQVKKIDYLVLTHPHSDHYMGLSWVFDNLQVDHFYDTRVNNVGATVIRKKAETEPGCVTAYPRPGDTLAWDPEVQTRVLNSCPDPLTTNTGAVINNCSIVLQISYHGTAALFQGDAQTESISRMIRNFGNSLESLILKVGHHGSRNATTVEWIDLVKPREAFIEVGKNNYGHPTPEVLSILQNAGATVHRTDQEGTIEYDL